jgi:hypothetical protein
MAIEQKEKIINGVTYVTSTLPARKGLKLFQRLMKILGPGMAALVETLDLNADKKESVLDKDIKGDVIGFAVKELLNQMDKENIEELILALFESTLVNNEPINAKFDNYFSNNYGELSKALFFVIEANFASFFTGLGDTSIMTEKFSNVIKASLQA